MIVILHPSGTWTAKRFSTFMLSTGAITATSFLFLAVLLFPVILVVPLLWKVLLACSLHRSRARRSLDSSPVPPGPGLCAHVSWQVWSTRPTRLFALGTRCLIGQ